MPEGKTSRDFFRGEAELVVEGPQNILLPEGTISKYIVLYNECQKRRKVPQVNQTCIFNHT